MQTQVGLYVDTKHPYMRQRCWLYISTHVLTKENSLWSIIAWIRMCSTIQFFSASAFWPFWVEHSLLIQQKAHLLLFFKNLYECPSNYVVKVITQKAAWSWVSRFVTKHARYRRQRPHVLATAEFCNLYNCNVRLKWKLYGSPWRRSLYWPMGVFYIVSVISGKVDFKCVVDNNAYKLQREEHFYTCGIRWSRASPTSVPTPRPSITLMMCL